MTARSPPTRTVPWTCLAWMKPSATSRPPPRGCRSPPLSTVDPSRALDDVADLVRGGARGARRGGSGRRGDAQPGQGGGRGGGQGQQWLGAAHGGAPREGGGWWS